MGKALCGVYREWWDSTYSGAIQIGGSAPPTGTAVWVDAWNVGGTAPPLFGQVDPGAACPATLMGGQTVSAVILDVADYDALRGNAAVFVSEIQRQADLWFAVALVVAFFVGFVLGWRFTFRRGDQ